MVATVADIIGVLETIAPQGLAEEWDNVGLQVGDSRWPVRAVWPWDRRARWCPTKIGLDRFSWF